MAAPSKLTTRTHKTIIDAIAYGATYTTAAKAAQISYASLNLWRNRGQAERERLAADPSAKPLKSEAPYLKFFNAIEQAEAELAQSAMDVIYETGITNKDANWARWILERRFPDEYAPKHDVTVKGDPNAPLVIRRIVVDAADERHRDES